MPYWTVAAEFKKTGQSVKAYYYPQRINSLSKANLIVDACRNQDGNVAEVETQDIALRDPNPFNLGDLQKEAYRTLKFTPSNTLAIAEKLYLSALISYPRTSSQKPNLLDQK